MQNKGLIAIKLIAATAMIGVISASGGGQHYIP